MSEANRTWRVRVSGVEHEIGLDHSTMTGKIEVKVDGTEIAESRLWLKEK